MADAPRRIEQPAEPPTIDSTKTNAELRLEVAEKTLAENVLRQLSQRIVQLQDEERRRIARELHDSIGQHLTAIGMSISSLEDRVRPEVRPEVEAILKQVENCSKDVRTISHLLHPPLLDEVGLSSAIEWYVGEFSRRGGIAVDLEMPPELGRLRPEVETAIFRIVQEALTNIHRHSAARNARVSIEQDETVIRMTISDNGRGISKEILERMASGKSGVGVTGMRERVKQLRAKFNVDSDSHGTALHVELPLTQ